MARLCRTPLITPLMIPGRARTATCVHSAMTSATFERTFSACDAKSTMLAPHWRLRLALYFH